MTSTLVALWTALAVQTPDTAAGPPLAGAMRVLNDSLSEVRGAAAAFRVDLAQASRELVLARAGRLRGRCAGAHGAALQVDHALASAPYTGATRTARVSLERALAELRAALRRCVRDHDAGPSYVRADSIKAWGPYRLARLEAAIRRYELAASAYREKARLR